MAFVFKLFIIKWFCERATICLQSSTPEKENENGEEKNDLMMCHYDVREKRRVWDRQEEEGGAFVAHG